VVDRLEVPGLGTIEASLVDATNPAVFVAAEVVGLTATEDPTALERDRGALARLEAIRGAAAVRMGLAATPEEAMRKSPGSPKIAVVAGPRPMTTLAGTRLEPEAMDLATRMLSMGQPHRAVPLTGAMCLAIAARIDGTVPNALMRPIPPDADVRLAHPSGLPRSPPPCAGRARRGWPTTWWSTGPPGG
jgi:2-methylaconitate cis-trans-isomerase PrpF